MSHRRPPLARALQLNTAVLVVEIAAGSLRSEQILRSEPFETFAVKRR